MQIRVKSTRVDKKDRVPPSRQATEDSKTSQVTFMGQKFPWFEEIPVTYVWGTASRALTTHLPKVEAIFQEKPYLQRMRGWFQEETGESSLKFHQMEHTAQFLIVPDVVWR